MRHVLSGAFSLMALGLGLEPARAAGFSIDPDPNSPTLGEILDRETRANAPRPALKPVTAQPPAEVVAMPAVPQGAVTVLAPRLRHRNEAVRTVYPVPPQRP
jgi:hypothetical protein